MELGQMLHSNLINGHNVQTINNNQGGINDLVKTAMCNFLVWYKLVIIDDFED